MTGAAREQRLFTFASGGWVLLLAGLFTLGLMVWAVAPAMLRRFERPPGDGKTIESYLFDLNSLQVPREFIVPAMLHRDMVPVMVNPTASGPDAGATGAERWRTMQRRNDPKYGKYLVSSDLVIGVTIVGEARAYPISVMYVHEIINDTMGGVPIAVTYHWPCASAMVFDRRIGEQALTFGVSGLVYNSNMLMYRMDGPSEVSSPLSASAGSDASRSEEGRPDELPHGGEDLWSQLLAKAISGEAAAAGDTLRVLSAELVTWADWSARHPNTTVLDRNLAITKRYDDAAPRPYMQSDKLLFPVEPLPPQDGPKLKDHVIAIQVAGGERRVYPVTEILARAEPASTSVAAGADPDVIWRDTLGDATLRFIGRRKSRTLRVEVESRPAALIATPAYWFAWHTTHPDDPLADLSRSD